MCDLNLIVAAEEGQLPEVAGSGGEDLIAFGRESPERGQDREPPEGDR
jgi:hypothetical protein